MSQQPITDFDIDPDVIGGSDLATLLNTLNSSLLSMRSGTSRPPSAEAGTLWLDTALSATHYVKFFDGTNDIVWFNVDTATHTISIPYADDNFYAESGGTISGDVTVDAGLNSNIDINVDSGGLGKIRFNDGTYERFGIWYADTSGEAAFLRYDDTGTLDTLFRFNAFGGVSVESNAPNFSLVLDGATDSGAFQIFDSNNSIRCRMAFDDDSDRMTITRRHTSGSVESELFFETSGITCIGSFDADTLHAINGATGTATSANTLTIVDGIITNIA